MGGLDTLYVGGTEANGDGDGNANGNGNGNGNASGVGEAKKEASFVFQVGQSFWEKKISTLLYFFSL